MFPVAEEHFVRGLRKLATLESALIAAIALLVVQLNWTTVRSWWYSPYPGKQVPQEVDLGNSRLIRFLLYLPKRYNPDGDTEWPLLLFLHGAGERGHSFNDLELLKRCGPSGLIDQRTQFPFVVASPQCPQSATWNAGMVESLVDYLVEHYRIDNENIVLAGYSMGGFGACDAVSASPNKYAGLITIAGARPLGLPIEASNSAYWAFHGDMDDVVPLSATEKVVKQFKDMGRGKPRLTIYRKSGHLICDLPFKDSSVLHWISNPLIRTSPTAP